MRQDDPGRMRAIAYALLGSAAEADVAVGRVLDSAPVRAEASGSAGGATDGSTDSSAGPGVGDPDARVARVCLERLRARESLRQDPWDPWATGAWAATDEPREPGRGGGSADPVDPALLAALDALTPAERVVFVLHDMFAVPIERVAPVVDRTPAATRQLLSRAAVRVRGAEEMPAPDLTRQREVVAALHAAARGGDADGLRALLDPDVLLRADAAAVRAGATTAHGARAVADLLAERAGTAYPALVDGAAGLVGQVEAGVAVVMAFTVIDGRVTAVDVLMDPGHLDRLRVEVLDGG
ncbi:sigma factor-like helix-turn-helix DNA-binding protein [Streptomyces sp. NPDC047981]|uniref:sigma factor-like helix-turn-helix DNA-binding protein n=1 Tax=Streptomyces sp. NPDC047981 TaxID=3154610 RepID=UPI003448FF38